MISSWLNSYLAVTAVALTLNALAKRACSLWRDALNILLMISFMFMLAQGIAILGSFLSVVWHMS